MRFFVCFTKGLYPAFERSVRGRFREIHRNTQETGSLSGTTNVFHAFYCIRNIEVSNFVYEKKKIVYNF